MIRQLGVIVTGIALTVTGNYPRAQSMAAPDTSDSKTSAETKSADCGATPAPKVNLSGCQLNWADFSGVDLAGANLQGTNFTGADLREATMVKSKLSGTIFDQALLGGAIYDNAKRCAANSVGSCE